MAFLFTTMTPASKVYASGELIGQNALPPFVAVTNLNASFNPILIKGLKIFPNEPLRFDFIVDKGSSQVENQKLKEESAKLIKYFLASLTVPQDDVWVNLSPNEPDRIIPKAFGITEMGRDLLTQDYFLKQITASLVTFFFNQLRQQKRQQQKTGP